ncbi:MAG: flagellar export protein FliJ [Clostridium sp.]|jgi:flagellar FliJ protein|uniref:flagellar export protein FliJ n=1 Tax=Clostridium sp. TaxID=1506 RepID=UPI0025C34222|nr:flagellar export protein FliJ [Clostridium sp.]MCH3964222.1 flagellar export protein FliJ [Clostridium sp.]MCI1715403.1 flagellar export protein FliJ [Clostridium sp.]MCI1799806.1 flagellar export protein FliJ [Clostridium sp.]MCI1813586.1 flagellar export protein FliJ [Clostridium sp.]MCI1870624.1 flagellar export protein FliJ [Clostridium sp.]
MKKYEFRLQKLLDIRLDRENESIMDFQKARKESLEVKQKLDMLKDNYNRYKDVTKMGNTVEQKMTRVYLNTLVYNMDETESELQVKEKMVDLKREELKQSQIERKTVDILKYKKEAAFTKEQNRLEQNANDEFALYGFIRKSHMH